MVSEDVQVFGGAHPARRMTERGIDAMREVGIEPMVFTTAATTTPR
jgi:hypothetical protein